MDQSADRAWDKCLEIIRDNVSRQSFKTWFQPLEAKSLEEDDDLKKLTLQLPSRFYYEWLEEHYFALLRKTITKVLGPKGRLFYDVVIEQEDPENPDQGASMKLPARRPEGAGSPSTDPLEPPEGRPSRTLDTEEETGSESSGDISEPDSPAPATSEGGPNQNGPSREALGAQFELEPPPANPFAAPSAEEADFDSQLNDSYTFERFIEGACNRLARGAAWSIANDPGGTSFNPFLVYGGVGLGKTHLIQAIGNYVEGNWASKAVLYVSSERFTTEFVQSIQRNRISEFSRFYRQVDVLVVDDVQFFSGKEKTQEEFFHIFNSLHQAGKQIVLSADRPPREIDGIEERLLSRFQWGLSADVQTPGLETRTAILRRKAEDDGIELDDEVIEFIARNIESNIRELEGALIRLLAHATLHQRDLDISLAREVLEDLVHEKEGNVTVEDIQHVVCEYLDISEDQVRGKTRKREIVRARQIGMYLSKKHTQHSLKTIGLHFGGRDHSTVIHAINVVEDKMESEEHYRKTVEAIDRKVALHSG